MSTHKGNEREHKKRRKGKERRGDGRRGEEMKGRDRKGKKRKGKGKKGKERRGKERKVKERKGKERKGKEREGKERKGKERKGKERGVLTLIPFLSHWSLLANCSVYSFTLKMEVVHASEKSMNLYEAGGVKSQIMALFKPTAARNSNPIYLQICDVSFVFSP
jgi:hypothetical protein